MKTRLMNTAIVTLLASAMIVCGAALANAQRGGNGGAAAKEREAALKKVLDEAAARPTPKLADGHPDLSGTWGAPAVGDAESEGPSTPGGTVDNPVFKNTQSQEQAGNISNVARRKANTAARPQYKPEFQKKWELMFDEAAKRDPSYQCLPQGVFRMGAPKEIVHTPKALYLLYAGSVTTPNYYRIVPTDGRARDKDFEAMPNGEALGHWEGDTLVVETIKFDDSTWLDGDGSFHSDALRVVERYTRKGNALLYEVTADDPKVFVKPFSKAPRTLVRGAEGEHPQQDWGCVERDQEQLTTNERH